MADRVLYEDKHFTITPDRDGILLHFNLSNKDYRFGGLEVQSLISKNRHELKDTLDKKIEYAWIFLADQGLNYDSVGFVLAQAYAVHGDLMKEMNLPPCQSEN